MKGRITTVAATWVALLLCCSAALLSCSRMSETVTEPSAGLNGGFEQTRDGLPVNWLLFSPETVPESDFDILFDGTDFKEGRQSLMFLVRECTDEGGWRSPGFARQVPAVPGETYRVSAWIKNSGTEHVLSAGGVSAKSGGVTAIHSSPGGVHDWTLVEELVTIAEPAHELRLELSIRSPGTLWIDDVRVELVEEETTPDVASSASIRL